MAKGDRARRRAPSRTQDKGETSKAIRNIAIVVLLVGLVSFFYVRSILSNRALDEQTLCPTDVAGVTAVLIDVTDPMNTPQRQDFRNQLDGLLSKMGRYEKLVVLKVNPIGDSLLTPVITKCNPGSAADVSEVDGNPKKLERQYRDGFISPMEKAFSRLLDASGADRSPIMESIQSVALSEFQPANLNGKPKRLVVASDLLQHTDRASFYEELPDLQSFVQSQDFNRVRTNLKGVEVELWLLQRDDSTQTQPRALPDFWEQIIKEQGGEVTRTYRVSG